MAGYCKYFIFAADVSCTDFATQLSVRHRLDKLKTTRDTKYLDEVTCANVLLAWVMERPINMDANFLIQTVESLDKKEKKGEYYFVYVY